MNTRMQLHYNHNIWSIHEEIESNLDEDKPDNFCESSETVKIEVNGKSYTLKTQGKMKTESVTGSPPPTPSAWNDNRTKCYEKLPRLEVKKFSGDYVQ